MREQLPFLFFHFLGAFFLSIVLTPVVRHLGMRWGAVDVPSDRKVHTKPIPRLGGLAIVLSFVIATVAVPLLFDGAGALFKTGTNLWLLATGGLVVFAVGLVDDFHRLQPAIKFGCQVLGATITFFGGVSINHIFGFELTGDYWILGYLVTIFWFVLFINAVNLIDGLDGLAAGIVFFSCSVMTIFSVWGSHFGVALLFAGLAGTSLGFLRYNFNPASVFMGDGGSYFLGYAIAGLSIISSAKSQVGATILIPLLALGIPIFDTILAPIRRFLLGKKMFSPDCGHIHHRLISMGLSTRKVVTLFYLASAVLCGLALITVNFNNSGIGAFLICLAIVTVLLIKRLGYLEYLAADKLYGWFKDVTDEAGFTHDRRTFLNLQMEINSSENLEDLWQHTCRALAALDFDTGTIRIDHHRKGSPGNATAVDCAGDFSKQRQAASQGPGDNGDSGSAPTEWAWTQEGLDSGNASCLECLLKLELPLLNGNDASYGTLWLVKDLKRSPVSHYTLRRVEHLRRTLTGTLGKMLNRGIVESLNRERGRGKRAGDAEAWNR